MAKTEKKPVAKKAAAKKLSLHGDSSRKAGQPRGHRVSFTYLAAPGKQVFVAGSFNDWNPAARELKDLKGTGEYFVRFLLPAGSYEYKLVVDGEWILDPANAAAADNGFGGQNNILVVEEK